MGDAQKYQSLKNVDANSRFIHDCCDMRHFFLDVEGIENKTLQVIDEKQLTCPMFAACLPKPGLFDGTRLKKKKENNKRITQSKTYPI